MRQVFCKVCGSEMQGLHLYFEQEGGAVCLDCVVECELPLDLPRESKKDEVERHPAWRQPQLEYCLDQMLLRDLPGPLLEPVEFSCNR